MATEARRVARMRLEGLGGARSDDSGATPERRHQAGYRRRRETRRRISGEGPPARISNLGLVVLHAAKEVRKPRIEVDAEADQGLDRRRPIPGRWILQGRDQRRGWVVRAERTAEPDRIQGGHADPIVPIAQQRREAGDERIRIDRSVHHSRGGDANQCVHRRDPDGRLPILQRPDQPRGRGAGPRHRRIPAMTASQPIAPRACAVATRTSASVSPSAAISGRIAIPGSVTPADTSSRVALVRSEGFRESSPRAAEIAGCWFSQSDRTAHRMTPEQATTTIRPRTPVRSAGHSGTWPRLGLSRVPASEGFRRSSMPPYRYYRGSRPNFPWSL